MRALSPINQRSSFSVSPANKHKYNSKVDTYEYIQKILKRNNKMLHSKKHVFRNKRRSPEDFQAKIFSTEITNNPPTHSKNQSPIDQVNSNCSNLLLNEIP